MEIFMRYFGTIELNWTQLTFEWAPVEKKVVLIFHEGAHSLLILAYFSFG